MRAPAGPLAAAVAGELDGAVADPGWAESWVEADAAARGAIESGLDELEGPTEPGLQPALGRLYEDGDLVYTGSSMPIRDQEAFLWGGDAEVLFLANRGANGIDGLVSSGIGAAAASGRPTVIVTGDLGLLHDIGGLAALAQVSTPVRIVVVDNGGGGIFGFLPQAAQLAADEFEALLATPRPLALATVAELFGIGHHRVDSLDQLPSALAAGTGLVEVPVDGAGNVDLHRRLSAAGQRALGA